MVYLNESVPIFYIGHSKNGVPYIKNARTGKGSSTVSVL